MCCISILNNSCVKPDLHAGRLPFPLKSPFLHWWDNPAGAGGMFVPLSFWWIIFKMKWNIISNYNCNLHLRGLVFFRLFKHQIRLLQYSILSYIPLIFIWRSSKCWVIESICKSTSLCLLPSHFPELASMIYIKCSLPLYLVYTDLPNNPACRTQVPPQDIASHFYFLLCPLTIENIAVGVIHTGIGLSVHLSRWEICITAPHNVVSVPQEAGKGCGNLPANTPLSSMGSLPQEIAIPGSVNAHHSAQWFTSAYFCLVG